MLHHESFGVSNIEKSYTFYDAVLLPLGYSRVSEDLTPGDASSCRLRTARLWG
ncbi:UNVERIFIED_ORG: catechol 2,3-dioxygenase-like lactoylglutathione lyase family enzyme [Rhizobium etli]